MNPRLLTDDELGSALSTAMEFQSYWAQAAKDHAADAIAPTPFLRDHLRGLDCRVRRLHAEFQRRLRAESAGVA